MGKKLDDTDFFGGLRSGKHVQTKDNKLKSWEIRSLLNIFCFISDQIMHN